MNESLRQLIWRRARGVCEYCLMPQDLFDLRHQIDHIVARQHGGLTTADNLALICPHCNSHKGPNVAGVDAVTGQLVRLFHPRSDSWAEHFEWAGVELVGLTPIGRATITVLAINKPEYLVLRTSLVAEGVFPFPPV